MSKKQLYFGILLAFVVLVFNVGVLCFAIREKANPPARISITLKSNKENDIQLFYGYNGQDWSEDNSAHVEYSQKGQFVTLSYPVPLHCFDNVRLDFGTGKSESIVSEVIFACLGEPKVLKANEIPLPVSQNLASYELTSEGLNVYVLGNDPFIVWDFSQIGARELFQKRVTGSVFLKKLMMVGFFDLVILIFLIFIRKTIVIPRELWHNRKLIWRLSKNDLKTRFAGSYLGVLWAFVQPIVTVFIYWFIFEKGFRSGGAKTVNGTFPFLLWLIAGIMPWFFFSDALMGGTNVLAEYSYLVKKVVFKISILPILKMISSTFVHVFFVCLASVIYAFYGHYPTIYYFQLLYYFACTFILTLGLSYFTCAINVFFKDLSQIINIVLQLLMWLTPVMWNIDIVNFPSWLKTLLRFNPIFYLVQGYRDCFINRVWFWDHPVMTTYYWAVMIFMLGFGMAVFRKLRIHFADVL